MCVRVQARSHVFEAGVAKFQMQVKFLGGGGGVVKLNKKQNWERIAIKQQPKCVFCVCVCLGVCV